MKVLVIAHNRENSGWGNACRHFIRAISSQIDTVVRPLILGDNVVDPEIEKLESKNLHDVTHCIQYTLPHYFSKNKNLEKNVGVSLFETQNLEYTNIPNYISLVDQFWDLSSTSNCNNSKSLYQAFECSDTNSRMEIPDIKGTYKFYTIGEFIKRKNFENMIRGFYRAFDNEPVSLTIKTSINGLKPAEAKKELEAAIKTIQIKCKLSYYPKIYIITEKLPYDQIKALHKHCDCYVDFSYGEAICLPMLEAAYFGRDIISVNGNKYAKLFTDKLCSSYAEPCYEQNNTFQWYNTSRETWWNPSIIDLSAYMIESYNDRKKYKYDMGFLSYESTGRTYLHSLLS